VPELITTPKSEIREKYERLARKYDRAEWLPEVLGLGKLRRALIGRAAGQVLEVAIGTGKNLPFYAPGVDVTGVDLSPAMLAQAKKQAARARFPVRLAEMDAEDLRFDALSFDTVASSCTVCTFPDPVRALQEMSRVCRPDGRILLLEHGRSDRRWLGGAQDRLARLHARTAGCQWNREPLELVRRAGLEVRRNERVFFGIFHIIEAMPAAASR
ncbi:MAG: class I SAM-dependent methyltransferase, partial [Alphaproteobacteria bacterium]